MLNDTQMERMLGKMTRLERTYEPLIFRKIGEMETRMLETGERLHAIPPADAGWKPVSAGDRWGGEGCYAWFAGEVRVPEAYAGQRIFLQPQVGGYEAMLWVNGTPYGTFATKIVQTGHGNHFCDLIAHAADPGKPVSVAVEFYAGHYILGTQPFETIPPSDFRHSFQCMDLCVKNQDIADFVFDLRALNQLSAKMDPLSYRRAEVRNCLLEVFKVVVQSPDDAEESEWRPALARAREVMAPVLAARNADSAPIAGIVGHSHMDTAWLWPIPETVKKCARTFSNQISLMDQFPEYRFIQSSAYHLEMIRANYPSLFEAIREKVAAGRYEPNGGVWVECDCNITSGESMIRQFLWGQRYTQRHFGYTSDAFWLPDTFGYSAAIPQIMQGSRVKYFLTTKLSWNDTNRFPHETFRWEGIDGSAVLTHFNTIQSWPDPKCLIEAMEGRESNDFIRNKRVTKRRLVTYGMGDGGGGPQFEMVEMSRRVRDLDGAPKAEHMSVSAFMQAVEREAAELPVYRGELYLELHRGTLTNQHEIKRNNRKAELLLRDLEFLLVRNAVSAGQAASGEVVRPLMETLLVNQFHDILPGTCIASAHDQCHQEMGRLLADGRDLVDAAAGGLLRASVAAATTTVTLVNTLGFPRTDDVVLPDQEGLMPADPAIRYQRYHDVDGNAQLVLGGVRMPAFSGTAVSLVPEASAHAGPAPSPFRYDGRSLETPYARVAFDETGAIASFVDRRNGRELRGAGHPLNTFLLAEDLPTSWDNWDVDADIACKYETPAILLERTVVADGPVQFRLRSRYRLSRRTSLVQDMVFHAGSARVDFETVLDWQDKHRFLKVGFDTTVQSGSARHEIQFGHCLKPTTRNHSIEQAMFEVLNHRFTDLSETRYGVAVLNDCKYGVSVEGGDIRLSLHKGGCRPDPRGDAGNHRFTYAFLPHEGGFSASNTVLPGYELNAAPIALEGDRAFSSLLAVSADHVIAETVKPCEDAERAFIVRLYESEGTVGRTDVRFGFPVLGVVETNMLEEPMENGAISLETERTAAVARDLVFRPFGIRTLKVFY